MRSYSIGGLDYVRLSGGYTEEETDYGPVVSFRESDELDGAIAQWIILSPHSICGQEVRFLRALLGLTQKQLADALGKQRGTVTRWEDRTHSPISGGADRALRAFYAAEREPKLLPRVVATFPEIQGVFSGELVMCYMPDVMEVEPELFARTQPEGPHWQELRNAA